MKYKIIATDMDDTLLNSSHEISEENIQSIIEVQEKGVKFVLASGRPTFAMHSFANELDMKRLGGYILGYNGGEIIDVSTGDIIFEKALTRGDIEVIYNEAKNNELSFLTYSDDTIYGDEWNDYTTEEVTLTGMKWKEINSFDELPIEKSIKCMILGEPEKLTAVQKKLQEKYKEDYVINISKPIFLEFTKKGINKGESLKRLCDMLGILTEEMICVGDSFNDMTMLEVAGLPVAVENAREEIKAISKFITTSNDNHALKTLIFKYFRD